MKIAVISSYPFIRLESNYGALLQYYALQTYLTHRGHDVYWIRNITFKQNFRTIIRRLRAYSSYQHIYYYLYNRYSFWFFIKRFIHRSDLIYYNYQMLEDYPPQADAYITGSDQVFNGIEFKENYLTFAPKNSKKIAYAASFGREDIDDNILNTMKPWLHEFTAISVRENFGVELCKKINIKSVQLLDPTF